MRTCLAILTVAVSFVAWAAEQAATAPRLLKAEELPIQVESEALQRQYDALLGMSLQRIQYSTRGPIHLIEGHTGIVLQSDATERKQGDSANDILPLVKDILLANGTESLDVRDNSIVYGSERALNLAQSIRGIPVANGGVSLNYDALTKRVSSVTAHFVPDRGLPRTPKLSAQQAEQAVKKALELTENAKVHIREDSYLAYYADATDLSPPQLVWAFHVVFPIGDEEIFFVNAVTGLVAARQPWTSALTRRVYDLNNTTLSAFPQGLPPYLSQSQIDAQEYRKDGHDYVKDADDYLRAKIPESLSAFPSKVHIVVRWGAPAYSNHGLVGSDDYLRFSGTSSGRNHRTNSRDIVVHEFAHGIGVRTFPLSGDTSDQQFRALSESFADIAATVVDVAMFGVPSFQTWIIGDGEFTSNSNKGERSFANPAGDSLAHYQTRDWFPTRYFWHGVEHYNSTIISHAYYLLVNGGQHARWTDAVIPDTSITALGESTTRAIFFSAFRDGSLDFLPDFVKMKSAAMAKALTIGGSTAQTQVKNAFEAVGICRVNSAPPTASPLVTIFDHSCLGQFDASWPAVAGASRYYAEVTVPVLGWAFAQPISDVTSTQCSFQISQDAHYRIRACNDCGCGPWSPHKFLEFHNPCL